MSMLKSCNRTMEGTQANSSSSGSGMMELTSNEKEVHELGLGSVMCKGEIYRGLKSFTEEDDHGSEEMEVQHVEEMPLAKKPRVEDDEEVELLKDLRNFRKYWEEAMSPFFGPLNGITGPEVGPKRYTDLLPSHLTGIDYDALEIFSIKVIKIKEGIEWPVWVFGLIAVRDSMDHKRNVLFERSKENYQTITAEDCSLELIGPSRAIALIDPPEFEIELSFIGSNLWDEKSLCAAVFRYNNNPYNADFAGLVRTDIVSSKRSTIEIKYSHLNVPLEATIEIHHSGGSGDFRGEFFTQMKYMGEDKIMLLDSKDQIVTIEPDGKIRLSRCVVLVEEGTDLTLGIKAWQGENSQNAVLSFVDFPTKVCGRSDGQFDFTFCNMSVVVFWSVLC